jgi:hypothetical protein
MSRPALTILILVIILVVIGGITLAIRGTPTEVPNGEVSVCTMDAKICPDGSAVGRIPPTCEFAACPVPQGSVTPSVLPSGSTSTATSGPITLEARINQAATTADLSIRPVEIIEDSRCAVGVQCIWAGTVRVKTTLIMGGTAGTSTIITLNTPIKVGTRTLELSNVLPAPRQDIVIAPADYRFTFIVR